MKNTKKKNGAAAKGKGRATLSAQQTIPYLSMHPDGVCKLPGGLYTKTVEYEDINYSVASTEDQTAIFSGWSSFLNYFDSSLPFQLSFINRRSHSRSRYQVNIPKADDNYNSVRDEFTGMLKNQIAKSNNGIERSKYITFGIPAEGIAEARPRLERVEADVMGNFKRKTLLPRTVLTSASPAHSASASIGARCPTYRLWHRSFRISCWRKS